MSAGARLLLVVVLGGVVLAGCGNPILVKPGQSNAIGDAYRVDPQIEWSRQQAGKLQIWTVDGPQLEQLRLYGDIADRDSLFPAAGSQARAPAREHRPEYRQGMRAHDVMELVAATLEQSGAIDVVAERLQPGEFGGQPGFRFELAFKSELGLAYRGLVAGMITADERLHLILYMGAQPHYFGAYVPTVRRLLDSVRLL